MKVSSTEAPRRTAAALLDALVAQQQRVAGAQAELAALALVFADCRVADDEADEPADPTLPGRSRPGEFVADEVSLALRMPVWQAQRLLARSRRLRTGLPEVWSAALTGRLDEPRLIRIDRAARLVVDPHVLATLDDTVIEVAVDKTVTQLEAWLQRFLAEHEPDAYAHRHEVSYADRNVSVVPALHGVGYVSALVPGPDACLIDTRLDSLARCCGADDPRSLGQRRADLFADLLLDRITVEQAGQEPNAASASVEMVEVELIDPDTGEYLGTRLQGVDADGEPVNAPESWKRTVLQPREGVPATIGVVVPLSTLTGETDRPGQLAARSSCLPAEVVRDVARAARHLVLPAADRPAGLPPRRHPDRAFRHWPARFCVSAARRKLRVPDLHRAGRSVRPRPPRTGTSWSDDGSQPRSGQPTTSPSQDPRRLPQLARPTRDVLDHAHRPHLPMPRRPALLSRAVLRSCKTPPTPDERQSR